MSTSIQRAGHSNLTLAIIASFGILALTLAIIIGSKEIHDNKTTLNHIRQDEARGQATVQCAVIWFDKFRDYTLTIKRANIVRTQTMGELSQLIEAGASRDQIQAARKKYNAANDAYLHVLETTEYPSFACGRR